MANRAAVVAAVSHLMEDDEDEEAVLLVAARICAKTIMELEEGEGYEDADGPSWTYVTVDINEYHQMGDPSFKLHFRMTRTVFEALVLSVGNHLTIMNRLRRQRTELKDALLMVVWLMATPDSFRSVALRFGVSPSTLYYHYTWAIESLTEMAETYIKWPNPEERTVIKNTFQASSGFPGIIGCIDCTHVNITAPVVDPRPYFNRKSSYSINVQAVVDHTLLVRHLHVGEPGSMNDNRVFKKSALHHEFLHDRYAICGPDEYLVGDGAYTLTDFMMIPFSNNGHLTEQQRYFNRCLSQCRVRVENAFGRGKGKWRRLKFLHARNQRAVIQHITASFVLHNFLILNGEPLWEGNELERPIHNNQILDFVEDLNEPDVEDELEESAEMRGGELRLFIMAGLLEDQEEGEGEYEGEEML